MQWHPGQEKGTEDNNSAIRQDLFMYTLDVHIFFLPNVWSFIQFHQVMLTRENNLQWTEPWHDHSGMAQYIILITSNFNPWLGIRSCHNYKYNLLIKVQVTRWLSLFLLVGYRYIKIQKDEARALYWDVNL